MKDEPGDIIYVGKARDLRKRLASYFKNSNQWNMKVGVLSQKIADFDSFIEYLRRIKREEYDVFKHYSDFYDFIIPPTKRWKARQKEMAAGKAKSNKANEKTE